jgi:polyisoprenoid-binding protein YceI
MQGTEEIAMSATDLTRAVEGTAIPAAGTFAIDASHSSVEFVARHLMVAKTRGRFGAFEGTVVIADRPEDSSVEVTIDAASIDTRDDTRDAHLRASDFFDVERFPQVTFRSTGVRHAGGDRWTVDGELPIKGVTNPVALDLVVEGVVDDPWGNQRAIFSARTEVDREAWGLTWNQALEGGGVLVGKKVRIEIEAEAVRQA